jgi:hypothetical protein
MPTSGLTTNPEMTATMRSSATIDVHLTGRELCDLIGAVLPHALTGRDADSYRMAALPAKSAFPDWRKLLGPALRSSQSGPPDQTAGVHLNPAMLARFGTAGRDGLPLHIRHTGQLVLVSNGGWFLGAIAPVRPPTADESMTPWLATTSASEAAHPARHQAGQQAEAA